MFNIAIRVVAWNGNTVTGLFLDTKQMSGSKTEGQATSFVILKTSRIPLSDNTCSLDTVESAYVHSNIYPKRCNVTHLIYIWKLLYIFRLVSPPIIRSTYKCIYSICYLSNRYCYLSLSWKRWRIGEFQLFHNSDR